MPRKKVKSKAKQPPKASIADTITSEIIAEAFSSVPQPVFMKVCRLCESKDGPFLNIFDSDKVTAKKIEELMPFGIAENDDLPHKICFRCSAKLEELYEFIQKCIKTQESLRTAIGKTGPFILKTKTRAAWEQKLNKTNMSNDDICDALIKKAMEGIKDIPLKPLSENPTSTKRVTRRSEPKKETPKKESNSDDSDFAEISLKEVKSAIQKPVVEKKVTLVKETIQPVKKPNKEIAVDSKIENNSLVNSLSFDYEDNKNTSDMVVEKIKPKNEKPFNIMDHISMIKVNGVGVLFQCKLCNRNFLKKEVVESHNCAKNGIPKVEIPKTVPVPEPPKVSTVKYIKIEDMKKSISKQLHKMEQNKPNMDNNKDIEIRKVEEILPPAPVVKPKPGPASKTRRMISNPESGTQNESVSNEASQNSESPVIQIPAAPVLNGRYKLVPGPNNIFTLVEESKGASNVDPDKEYQKPSKKRKAEVIPDLTNVEEQSKPYPVGLFHTSAPPAPFTTPAAKKQSYTIVQTGNPSKLLISTKPQTQPLEVPKKKTKKSRQDVNSEENPKEPFNVTLEDVAHPKDAGFFTFINVDPLLQPSYVLPTDNIIQESQISTSSSVFNNAPESSKNDKEKYTCNMCGENFSREKKLLAHIQSHYTKMDEEDHLRAQGKGSKKRKSK